jgi:thiol-disulfide isomerase/thioredoxin
MLTLSLLLVIAASQGAQTPAELTGVLDRLPTADEPSQPVSCIPATEAERNRLIGERAPLGRAWACQVFYLAPDRGRAALLIEHENRMPLLYIDVNGDKLFTAGEGHVLPPEGDLLIKLPPLAEMKAEYPVRIRMAPPELKHLTSPVGRLLLQSFIPVYAGSVTIGGKQFSVEYPADWPTLEPTAGGWVRIDGNGDGHIDADSLSPERTFGARVMRVGDRYVSTVNIDPVTRVVKLREHPRSEYRRIELTPGTQLPDFTFVDLTGTSSRLSDMTGRLVLLFVWAPWCPPAVDELQHVQRAHQALHSKGVEVLGLTEGDVKEVPAVAQQNGVTWRNTTPASVEDLLKGPLHIFANPTYIVLDSDRRIVAVSGAGEAGTRFRGTRLVETLRQLLQ